MLKNQKGFTLIEALIALSITSILILATSTSFMKLYDYINLNQTLATIQADLAYIRQANMMPKSSQLIQLKIYRQHGYYDVSSTDEKTLYFRRYLPPGVSLNASEAIITLSFNIFGHIDKGQTIVLSSRHFKKSIVFSIGAGGVDIR